jgi:hypothetical protein
MTPAPCSTWCRCRADVFAVTCDLFPDSVTFAQAQNRALPAIHRALSQRSSASSERSFASVPQPLPCTRVLLAVLNHLFPDSVTFAKAQNHALPAMHRALSQRSSALPERSFASAPQPLPCTRVSLAALNWDHQIPTTPNAGQAAVMDSDHLVPIRAIRLLAPCQ